MKMTDDQINEVKEIFKYYNVKPLDADKIMSFLNSSKAFVKIEYDTNIKLKKSLKNIEPALRKLQSRGYNIKFDVKGLLIKIQYLYQIKDVKLFNILDTNKPPESSKLNINIENSKQFKLGNLILQKFMLKIDDEHPIIKVMGRQKFVNNVKSLLLRPVALIIQSDKQYEKIIKNSLRRIFKSKTVPEFKAVCSLTINSANEYMKQKIFDNVLFSATEELSEIFENFDDDQEKNVTWKLKLVLPYLYSRSPGKFMPRLEKIISKLKKTKTYEQMLNILNSVEKQY